MKRRKFLAQSLIAATAAARTQNRGVLKAAPSKEKLRVAIIGCGRMGQYYAEVYRALPDTEIVAIAEWNPERRKVVGERFGVKALYQDAPALLKEVVPDIAAVITPTKFMKEAVIACAQAGVKGVSTDKPIAARLADADAMVEACAKRNIVFAGGNLQRARHETQEAGKRLVAGQYGKIRGASIHAFGGEISGGGCQHLSVLRLMTGAEVEEIMAWGSPAEALAKESDEGLSVNGCFRLSTGVMCSVFGTKTPYGGVDVWTDNTLVRWDWDAPQIYSGLDAKGARKRIEPNYSPFPWRHVIAQAGLRAGDDYLVASIKSFIEAVKTGSKLAISGHDLRQALEIAIAAKLSAQLGNLPVKLPLKDRSLTLYPSRYRWLGGDQSSNPQSAEDAKRLQP